VPLQSTRTYEWNRRLGTALLDRGVRLDALVEHDSVPWEVLPGRTTLRPDGECALTEQPSVMPLSYTIRASKASLTGTSPVKDENKMRLFTTL
jgi:hypothetical protein